MQSISRQNQLRSALLEVQCWFIFLTRSLLITRYLEMYDARLRIISYVIHNSNYFNGLFYVLAWYKKNKIQILYQVFFLKNNFNIYFPKNNNFKICVWKRMFNSEHINRYYVKYFFRRSWFFQLSYNTLI